jgi:probable FeS assembly SUF system protein SufT
MRVTNGSASFTAAKVRTDVRTSKFKAQLALNFNARADRVRLLENRQTALETINNCMQKVTTVELTRDCKAVQIPHGASVMLPRGTSVDITQTLGGSYTIHAQGGLFRVAGPDADALGIEASAKGNSPSGTGDAGELSEQQIWDTLRTCYDPEIPVNIVDLGLVYHMQCKRLPNGNQAVDVRMTLTAPGCGMGPSIAGDAQQKLLCLDGVEDARVEIVWDPPWHQSMITAEGRRILGLE